ncbi:hypothetical protein FA048_08515 [Pedobacter polaris]|uniref:Alpha/beta hydrolase n=1 Tax=Pedobacter polaris TaxID=2571273 RepID=A0A4U1CVK2_9SPHI|nr:hypothetical protein [Pedobacter polaris]TKC10229.1 hypothetical protein FA048_08515 [Pedobacter polaris]
MRWLLIIICLLVCNSNVNAQLSFAERFNSLQQLSVDSGVTLTFDEPSTIDVSKPTILILFALPNGNTSAQSFGKKLVGGDDWHFDIQHIGAQTAFIRNTDQKSNYIVAYIENNLKSWPAWRKKFGYQDERLTTIVEITRAKYLKYNPQLILSCHSGGGSFVFGYINAQTEIPKYIQRIGFLDATYGYETEKHAEKLKRWLKAKNKSLQVIAYNDSVVVYNGKPLVSPTGGTWYRSKLMANDLQNDFKLKKADLPHRLNWNDKKQLIEFTLIKNPAAKIYHTVLVEKNGFIQLVFNGTAFHQINYNFWEDRVYSNFILK